MATPEQIQAEINKALSGLYPAEQWRKSYLEFQEKVFADAAKLNPARAAEARFSGTLPIHMLPVTQQAEHMKRFRELTGLDSILNNLSDLRSGYGASGVENVMANINAVRGLDTSSPFGVLPLTYQAGDHPVKAVLSGLNLNYDERVRPIR
jgi:hypothetical protein